jgi:hypothetical protein
VSRGQSSDRLRRCRQFAVREGRLYVAAGVAGLLLAPVVALIAAIVLVILLLKRRSDGKRPIP